MTTKSNTSERNLYSTPCRKLSQGNYKIIPAVEKGQMGPLKAYSRLTSCFSRTNYSFVILTDACLTCSKASNDRRAMTPKVKSAQVSLILRSIFYLVPLAELICEHRIDSSVLYKKIYILFLTTEEFNAPPVLTEYIVKTFIIAVAVCLQLSFHPDIK